jgi:hypothetical protein
VSAPGQLLATLDLPLAPPVTRPIAPAVRRPKTPAVALVVLGALLVLVPIVGGMFSRAAAGKQLIDEFEPHLEVDALARYDGDLATLRTAAAALDTVYAEQGVVAGRFPGIDEYRGHANEIDQRASELLVTIRAAEPDYRRAADIGGFDRVPFLIVVAGLVALYGGCVLLFGTRGRGRPAAALVVVATVALALYPFVSDLSRGTRAGERMLDALTPVMREAQVRQLQDDFVLIVHAVGELDTGFRDVPQPGAPGAAIAALVDGWPAISSDLATLVGAINDNLDNFTALRDLDSLTSPVGLSGLTSLPWVLVGVGAAGAVLAGAAWPRVRKETT